MKPKTLVSAVLFAALSALAASGAYAADTGTAPAGKADKAPAMGMSHDQMMQHHSQMQEQAGTAPKAAAPAGGDKTTAAKDKRRHFHPRDGK